MALEHRTAIGGLTIDRGGNASLLLHLIVADGAEEYSQQNHRIPIIRDENLAAKAAQINAILTSMGRLPLPAREANVIGKTLTACWAAMNV